MKRGMGLDGFVWFEGRVEDRSDPLAIGRVRVRCLSFDSDHEEEMPTATLPWAYPMLPLNSAQGSVRAPKEGTWVFGFFRDGEDAQDRVVVGTINTGYNEWTEDENDLAPMGEKQPLAVLPKSLIPPGVEPSQFYDAYSKDIAAGAVSIAGNQGVLRYGDAAALGISTSAVSSVSVNSLKEIRDKVSGVESDVLASVGSASALIGKTDEQLEQFASGAISIDGIGSATDLIDDMSKQDFSLLNLDLPDLSIGASLDFANPDAIAGLIPDGILNANLLKDVDLGNALESISNIDIGKLTEGIDVSKLGDLAAAGITEIGNIAGNIPGVVQDGVEKVGDLVDGGLDQIKNIDTDKLLASGLDMAGDAAMNALLSNPAVAAAMAGALQALQMLQMLQDMQKQAAALRKFLKFL
jgi:hypothetical protein